MLGNCLCPLSLLLSFPGLQGLSLLEPCFTVGTSPSTLWGLSPGAPFPLSHSLAPCWDVRSILSPTACDCNPDGSAPGLEGCDPSTGQCRCLPHVTGRACGRCQPGYYDLQPAVGCKRYVGLPGHSHGSVSLALVSALCIHHSLITLHLSVPAASVTRWGRVRAGAMR